MGGEAEIIDMIRDVDTSGDGQIDYDEFIAYLHRTEPESDSWAASRDVRKRCTEKLGVVIDQCLQITGSANRDSAKTMAAFGRLPTLLGRSGVTSMETKR